MMPDDPVFRMKSFCTYFKDIWGEGKKNNQLNVYSGIFWMWNCLVSESYVYSCRHYFLDISMVNVSAGNTGFLRGIGGAARAESKKRGNGKYAGIKLFELLFWKSPCFTKYPFFKSCFRVLFKLMPSGRAEHLR